MKDLRPPLETSSEKSGVPGGEHVLKKGIDLSIKAISCYLEREITVYACDSAML